MLEQIDQFMASVGVLAYLAALAATLEYVVPPFSRDSVVLLGGVACAVRGDHPWWGVFAAVLAGSVLGAACNYWIGTKVAHRFERTPRGPSSGSPTRGRVTAGAHAAARRVAAAVNRFLLGIRGAVFIAAAPRTCPSAAASCSARSAPWRTAGWCCGRAMRWAATSSASRRSSTATSATSWWASPSLTVLFALRALLRRAPGLGVLPLRAPRPSALKSGRPFKLDSEQELLEGLPPQGPPPRGAAAGAELPAPTCRTTSRGPSAGFHVNVVFARPGSREPIAIAFQRDNPGGEGLATRVCEWCHAYGSSMDIGMLSVDVTSRHRVGVLLCLDLRCKEKLENGGEHGGQEHLLELTHRVLERMHRFAHEALGLEPQPAVRPGPAAPRARRAHR